MQLIMAGAMPKEDPLQNKPASEATAKDKDNNGFKEICPDCATTHLREQAKKQRQVQEMANIGLGRP